MKKIITLVLAAVLMLSCMTGVALAAKAGETVKVEFKVENNPGFASFGAILHYDASALELVSIEAGELCTGSTSMFITNGDKLTYINTVDVTADGVLFVATFNVKATAAPGTYAVTVEMDDPQNASGQAVTVKANDAAVEVEATECEHAWDEGVVTTAATCEQDGVKTYTCSKCGATKTEVIAALGHKWGEWEVTTAATCEAAGVETRVCANDKNHVETREIKATGHDLSYKYDETNHWKVCDCGHETAKEAHKFENNGYCVCGYKKPDDGKDPGLDDEPDTGDITALIVLGVMGVTAMGGTTIAAFKRKKK